MNRHRKLLHCSELAHSVCTESVRGGGTSAAKSLKIPGPTTCAPQFGPILKMSLSCPLYMRLVVSLREMKQGSKSRFPKNGKRPVIGPPP